MLELMFVACLSAEPKTCDEQALQFVDMPMMTCMMGAQPILAQWANEHPGWEVQRWSCRHPEPGRNT